jgi:micrococcal nuclease
MRIRYVVILCMVFLIGGLLAGISITKTYYSTIETSSVFDKQSSGFEYQGKVTRIIDGDTIEVDGTRIRLVGIDTPERGEPGFNEATDFVKSLCPVGSTASLDVDDAKPKDKYGRTLAVVYCQGVHVNAELLR